MHLQQTNFLDVVVLKCSPARRLEQGMLSAAAQMPCCTNRQSSFLLTTCISSKQLVFPNHIQYTFLTADKISLTVNALQSKKKSKPCMIFPCFQKRPLPCTSFNSESSIQPCCCRHHPRQHCIQQKKLISFSLGF